MTHPDVGICVVGEPPQLDTLTSHPRVASAGTLATANVGIEHLVVGVLTRPAIDHLVVCGRDSRVFRAGQSLVALARHGLGENGTIRGALGYRAELPTLDPVLVEKFRHRVVVHDLLGCIGTAAVLATVTGLPRRATVTDDAPDPEPGLPDRVLRPLQIRGRRVPAGLTGDGYFVVTVDDARRQLVLRHYHEDLLGGSILSSHNAEALMLSAISYDLVSDRSHAAYLGAELAKAETALRLGLRYVQDRPLRPSSRTGPPRLHRTERSTDARLAP